MEGGGVHVLHVDDDQQFLDLLETRLQRVADDVTVTGVTSVEEGLQRLAELDVDCIVSGYELSGKSGLEFLEEVRESHPDLPFILLTGEGSETLASRAVSAGADGYMPKHGHTDQFQLLANRIETLVSKNRAETSYREVFEKAAVAMSIRDPETGAFIDANEQYCELMGYSREEVTSLTSSEVGVDEPPHTAERARELLRRTVEEGPRTVEWVNERRDGTPIHVESTLKPAEIRGRTLVLVSLRDITEQKRHERRMNDLQRRTRELMRAETSTEVAETAVETAEETLELPFSSIHLDDGDGELRGVAATDAVHEQFGTVPDYERDDDGPVTRAIWDVFESGETLVVEDVREHDCLSKEEVPVRSGIVHPLGEHGVFITSTTEPNAFGEAELALAEMLSTTTVAALDRAERQRRYDAIFNQTFQFTGLMEPDGTLVEVSDAALEFAGLDREDVVGRSLWESPWFQYSEESRLTARKSVERARNGEFFRDEVTVVGADGTMIIDYSVRPVTDENDDVMLLIPEGRDITELKQRERELQRKNQQLEEFASVVSHDLRNPLGVASGYLELAREECDTDHLEHALRAHDRMASLIDDLLALAKEGREVDSVEPVRLETICREAWANVETGGAELRIESDLTFEADRSRVSQLFENLFANAVEHGASEEGGAPTVTVGALYDGFYVEDDGPGIPPDQRDRVFEVGYSTSEEGTGFGLRIVERIATAHGWSIDVVGSDGGGARFEITGLDP